VLNYAPRHEDVWRSGSIDPPFSTSTLDGGVVSFTSWLLYPRRKDPQYPFDRRLSGPQNRSGGYGEEKNLLPLPRIKPRVVQFVVCPYTYLAIPIIACVNYKLLLLGSIYRRPSTEVEAPLQQGAPCDNTSRGRMSPLLKWSVLPFPKPILKQPVNYIAVIRGNMSVLRSLSESR
jgi:hypothetical protein